ncbi:MAG: AAA family ATPase [Deltaproteobacteria bacterium]|nr:AAA family ATPase [Deltaproteobacteria bacterium]
MYNVFFGFSEQPFNVTPNPKFLFYTESHREALASMAYGINERKGFVSITGETGTGKTTLIRQLLDDLPSNVKVVFISQTKVTFEQLLRGVLHELEMPIGYQDKSSLIRQFNNYLMERLGQDKNLAIIIDEAQHLSNEAMEDFRLLSNLETATSKLVQIILVGQPELEDKLNSSELRQFKQRIAVRRRILPLREEDSRRYIEHRLKMVGNSTSQVFTPEAVSMICHYCKGVPRVINILCDNAFLIGHERGKKKINALIIQEVLRHMEVLPEREINVEEPGYKKRIRTKSMRLKNLLPRFSYITIALFGLALVILFGSEYLLNIKKNLELRLSGQQPVDEQKVAAPAAESESALTSAAAPTPAAEEKPATRTQPKPENNIRINTVIVEENETIRSLAQKYYDLSNTTLADYILRFNPGITNPDLVKAYEKINIPEVAEEALIIQDKDDTYKVHLATFLQPEFAQKYKNEPLLQGKKIEIIPLKFPAGQIYYRVTAGKFASREESLKTIQTLKEKGLLPYFR